MTDTKQHVASLIGVAESIIQRLQNPAPGQRWYPEELRDMYRTLSDIEDRLYGKNEYAPTNRARV